jgi:hypothetical protein
MVPIIQTLLLKKKEKNIRHLAKINTMMIGGGSCKKCKLEILCLLSTIVE